MIILLHLTCTLDSLAYYKDGGSSKLRKVDVIGIIRWIVLIIVAAPTIILCQDGTIWFAPPDGSPLIFRIDSKESVPVWIQTNPDVSVAALHIPLGSDDRFIARRLGGRFFQPFVNDNPPEGFDKGWDSIDMRDPIQHQNKEGFTSQGILGFSDLAGKHNVHLHCDQKCKILEFDVFTANDDSLRGHTYHVFIEGFDPRIHGISLSDTIGRVTYKFDAHFSPVHFLYPGDINADYKIDADDLKRLELYLESKADIAWPEARGDCNDDGVINKDDLSELSKIINNNSHPLK